MDDSNSINDTVEIKANLEDGEPAGHFTQLLARDHRVVVETRVAVVLDAAVAELQAEAAYADAVPAVGRKVAVLHVGDALRVVQVRIDDAQAVVVVVAQPQPVQHVVVQVDAHRRRERHRRVVEQAGLPPATKIKEIH